jgi:hypothetical protein
LADFLAEAVWTAAPVFDCAAGFLAPDFTAAFFTGAFFFAAEAGGWKPQASAAIDRAAAQVRIIRIFSGLV